MGQRVTLDRTPRDTYMRDIRPILSGSGQNRALPLTNWKFWFFDAIGCWLAPDSRVRCHAAFLLSKLHAP